MKSVHFILFFYLVLPLALSSETNPVYPQNRSVEAFQEDLEKFIKQSLEELGTVPGLSVAVVKGDQPAFMQGFGYAHLDKKIKSDEKTNYYIASSTKSFTGLLAGLLEEEGVLDLDARLTDFYAPASFPESIDISRISLRHLVTHTSGIENSPIVFRLAYTGDHSPDLLEKLLAHTEGNEAGFGNYSYSNFGYNLYTMVLEKVTGKPWQQWLEERLFDPMGTDRTTAYMSRVQKYNWTIAQPYAGILPGQTETIYLLKKDNNMQSAGGLITTAEDLTKWLEVNMNQGKLDGQQIIPASVINKAHSRLAEVKESREPFGAENYGLGWHIGRYNDQKVLSHFGGYPGFLTHVSFMPEQKIGVAVMVNDAMAGGRLMNLIATYAYDWWLETDNLDKIYSKKLSKMKKRLSEVGERIVKNREERAERTWDLDLDFADYSGNYHNDIYGTVKIKGDKEKMAVSMGNLQCIAEPFPKKNAIRIELVPGSGEVIVFKLQNKDAIGFDYDDTFFEKMN